MVTQLQITRFLNNLLDIRNIPDSSRNGMQVRSSKKDISKIAFAVDACLETFKKAKKAGADMIIVHHGLFWKPVKREEVLDKRVQYLKNNRIALYACHLPLDMHESFGNNINLASMLGLKDVEKFGGYHGMKIGFKGGFEKEMTLKKIETLLNKKIKARCRVLDFGNKKIRTIGIVSGGGGCAMPEIKKEKLDVLLTGELKHSDYNYAQDLGINVIEAGHYATETVGVKALMPLLKEKFKIETIFIDNPTGY